MSPAPAVRLARVLSAVLLALVVIGCGGGQASTLVTYQRDWPDGFHEELSVLEDGKVTMRHGETLERLTLTSDQVRMLRESLAAGLPMGDQGDSLVRTVILGNGTSHSPVMVEPGSSVELLEVLMTTHSLGGVRAEGVSPPPERSVAP
jgi:hypothetical protein